MNLPSTRRATAVTLSTLVLPLMALPVLAGCTNDYDALTSASGAGGDAASSSSAEVASSVGSAVVSSSASSASTSQASSSSTSGGGGAGGEGGGGSGGDGGSGGVVELPDAIGCAGLSLDFEFELAALPPPWTTDIAGQVDLASGDGALTATFGGNSRNRAGLAAPIAPWEACSVAVSLADAPDLSDLESTRVAAYIGASGPGGPLPSLVVMSSVDAAGEPLPEVIGAVRLSTSPGELEWAVGPIEREGVRFLRLRRSGASLFYDVAIDGIDWTPIAEILAEPDRVTVGAWKEGLLQSEELLSVSLGPVNP